jgi:hypothetical protein
LGKKAVTDSRPGIFHFNPTCEIAIANGSPYFVPPALLKQFEADLAPLMMHFAGSGDIVISGQPPKDWLDRMNKAGFPLPCFKTLNELRADFSVQTPLGIKVEPWGKSPAANRLFRFLGDDDSLWQDGDRAIFERKTTIGFLKSILSSSRRNPIIDPVPLPEIVQSESEIASLLSASAPLVLKAPLSSSGRGLAVLRRNKLNESNRQWIRGILEQQGYLTAEPWFNKQLDLSLQFRIGNDHRVSYLGSGVFHTNSNGQYSGHELNFRDWQQIPGGQETLSEVACFIQKGLENSVYSTDYKGQLGVDMIIYNNAEGKLKIHPCLEINPRYTMGYLSQQLEKKIHPEARGFFRISFGPGGNLLQLIKNKQKSDPLIMQDGIPRKGFLELTPVTGESKFCAYLELF